MKKGIILIAILAFLVSSCSLTGLNLQHKTPKKPGKYPVFTENDTLRGMNDPYRANFDVSYYNIDIDVNIEERYIKGFVDIDFIALENLNTIHIDLYENMLIDSIIFNNEPLDYSRKYNAVFVNFTQTVLKNDKSSIRVYYEGRPRKARKAPWDGGFVWKKDKDGNPWIAVACEEMGASLWWPVKDHLSDEPDSITFTATIPAGLICISNGRLINQARSGEKETFTWKTTYPINTYDVTLYIGNFNHFQLPCEEKDSTFMLDFYVLPYNFELARKQFAQAQDIIRFFEKIFGDYPWPRDGYKLVDSPYEGMENQTAIAYGAKYGKRQLFGNDYIILHETAHEWWGNSVSCGDYAEIWLHEGFATYSEALYVEEKSGHEDYLAYMNMYSAGIKNQKPVIGPYNVNYWDYKDSDPYLKGALFLHTLRNTIADDSLFFDIIKTYYDRSKYSITTTQAFLDLVNEKTAKDYKWLFDAYLHDRRAPVLALNYERDPSTLQFILKYKWSNMDENFKVPVKLKTDLGTYIIYPGREVQEINLGAVNGVYCNMDKSYMTIYEFKDM